MGFLREYRESLKVHGFDFAEEMVNALKGRANNKDYPVLVFIYILQLMMEKDLVKPSKRNYEL
jgi:hypothetical protein